MPTVTERYDALRTRAIARGALNPADLGIALQDYLQNAVAASTLEIREAITDIEEAACLALGADPNGAWLSLLDDLRTEASDDTEQSRRNRLLRKFSLSEQRSVLREIHLSARSRREFPIVA